MAQKRMIDRKISVSEQVADLSVPAQLVFTWSIPHTDDVGALPSKHRTLKALLVPMWDCSLKEFDIWVEEIVKQGLWKLVDYKDKQFYFVTKWREHQTLQRDRQPKTLLDIEFSKKPKESWNTLYEVVETLGFQMENNDFQLDTEEKRREEKRSEEKGSISADAQPTPAEQAKLFFHYVQCYKDGNLDELEPFSLYVNEISKKSGADTKVIYQQIIRFTDYWTERNKTGKKQRWELEKTFEVTRRLQTWFNRAGMQKSVSQAAGKGKNIII